MGIVTEVERHTSIVLGWRKKETVYESHLRPCPTGQIGPGDRHRTQSPPRGSDLRVAESRWPLSPTPLSLPRTSWLRRHSTVSSTGRNAAHIAPRSRQNAARPVRSSRVGKSTSATSSRLTCVVVVVSCPKLVIQREPWQDAVHVVHVSLTEFSVSV